MLEHRDTHSHAGAWERENFKKGHSLLDSAQQSSRRGFHNPRPLTPPYKRVSHTAVSINR